VPLKYDYEELLERAYEQLPEEVLEDRRFEVPKPRVSIEGKMTIIQNFKEIADKLNRDPEHLSRFFLKELGTAGHIDGDRLVLHGTYHPKLIEEELKEYVEEFVLCPECGRPDTKLVREDRQWILKCEACGAWSSVRRLK
jgi:translation initiation factor 2 subunit 2